MKDFFFVDILISEKLLNLCTGSQKCTGLVLLEFMSEGLFIQFKKILNIIMNCFVDILFHRNPFSLNLAKIFFIYFFNDFFFKKKTIEREALLYVYYISQQKVN